MRRFHALRARLSQRGACLLLIAALDLINAQALATAPAETRAGSSYTFLATLLPLPVWAALWAAVGLLCLLQAWTQHDRAAYTAASILKILWALLHLGAWAAGLLPRGYVSAAVWLLAAGFVSVVATVPRYGRQEHDDA